MLFASSFDNFITNLAITGCSEYLNTGDHFWMPAFFD